MLKAAITSRASPFLRWVCIKQGIWMYPTRIPRADHCSLSPSRCTCRSELRHQSQRAAPCCAQHFVQRWLFACLELLVASGSTQTRIPVGFDLLSTNFLPSSIFSPPSLPGFCRTGLRRSPSASLFQTWTSCEQLLRPSAHCFGNSWKMFTLVALAALSRKESG